MYKWICTYKWTLYEHVHTNVHQMSMYIRVNIIWTCTYNWTPHEHVRASEHCMNMYIRVNIVWTRTYKWTSYEHIHASNASKLRHQYMLNRLRNVRVCFGLFRKCNKGTQAFYAHQKHMQFQHPRGIVFWMTLHKVIHGRIRNKCLLMRADFPTSKISKQWN